ncbi:TonB-linked outer membrane protein, SusC/RagA family [Flavobacterium glycines]|uniref:SusC/RagA family TonB-linked outer membrane protein n=1 Tax=Flavobacterium glycines TaxID=551990 RepID=A0A1B9DMS2_9FLAO|nr:SusC/RagA family TonB-linked outer membrane protein [Flavobacterium glycines]OCB71010.1 SusC/RagA family TonB-linked outer membrane protein [Flavobacterium glycines]GEL10822.1 SusC/RagA family TonB-linked outer membrane protein [Flavobacterium glycines]SDI52805.1 TonB-linked outer membrane protein, SusC/RagA family [Flavobacterium glycines]
MLKIIKLTCVVSIFFAGELYMPLFAQEAHDATKKTIVTTIKKNSISVQGVVKSAQTKKPLSGINVTVDGFSAAITNDDGSFKIKVPHLDAVLKISGQDFQTKVYAVKKKDSGIEIFLNEANYSQNYEIADMAAGDKMQYDNTNASTVVNFGKDQWSNPVNQSVGSFLQGRVAGLTAIRNSGTPSSGTYLTLRGFNSLYATNKPLIIVDGMIYDDEDYGSGIVQNNVSSPLSNIDVKDIEDVTVIKDGTSLYGTKGANGVIKITTIRPTELSTKIDFTMYGGVNQAPDQLPLLGSDAYRTHLSQLEASRGLTQSQIAALPYMNDNPDVSGYYKYHNNTNWQDQIFKSSVNQNYFLKVRGGDDIAKFGLSVGYLDSKGIVDQTQTKRYSTRLNAALRLTEKLSVDANLSFINNVDSQWDQGYAYKTSPLYLALTKAPFLTSHDVNDAGEVSPNLADVDYFNVSNPNAILDNGFGLNKNYRFFGNLKFNYALSKSWDLNTILGLTLNKERETFFIPDMGVADLVLPTAIAKNRSGSEVQIYNSIFTDTYANYTKHLNNDHNVDVRFGLRTQSNKSESDLGLGYNSSTDDFTSVGAGSNLLRQVGGALGEWNWLNIYANADYNYRNKYFLTTSYAVDGSSRFGDKLDGSNKYALMSSLTGAWLVSSEGFMKNLKNVDYLKLRATYGYSGNDDIGNFTAQKYYISQNLLGMQGLVTGNIGNPNLQWETVKKFNVGADLGLFNERVSASVDFYNNRTRNMIVYESISNLTGFDYVASNSGAMRTLGAELALKARVVNSNDFTFDLGLNLSRYKNEVQGLPNGDIYTQFAGATYLTSVGKEANLFYGLKANGVFSTTAEATTAGLNRRLTNGDLIPFTAGDMRYVDTNNDHVIDNSDRVVIGNPNPDVVGSFSANFTYKRFSLQGLFNFSIGNDIYNGLRYNLEKMSGYENQSAAVANRWIAEGQQTDIPKAVWGDPMGNAEFSSRWIEDGSYLRLKTVVLGYDFKVNDINYIKYIKLYASANNLFTFTKYLGYDPEFSATSSIFGQGTDIGLAPQFKTFQLGLRLGL